MKDKTQNNHKDAMTTIHDTQKYFEYIVSNIDWTVLDQNDIDKAIRKIDAGMSALIRVAINEDAWKPIESE